MQPRRIARFVGITLCVLGLFMITSLFWAWLDRATHDVFFHWLSACGITLGVGGLGVLYGKLGHDKRRGTRLKTALDDPDDPAMEITRREALVIVALTWFACGVFGGLPFIIDGMVASPVDAFFEATSGFTTTGSTILTEIEGHSRAALWWRSMIQWLGGMGIVVLFVAIFPQVGAGGRRLFESEAPGPTKDQLRPRIRETGLILWRIYLSLTAVLAVLLFLEGMTVYEALCHAFTTMATGGFSTKNASVAGFDSWLIDGTITIFMMLAGLNFGIYYSLWRRKMGWQAFKDGELVVYLGIFVGASLVVTYTLMDRHGGDVLQAFRYASFQVASLVTSTGFGTDDFDQYPAFSRGLLMFLMFIGGMGGSTAGGFKVSRAIIVFSTALQEVRHAIHPKAVFATRVGGRSMDESTVRAALALGVIASILLAVGTLFLAALGLEFETAFSAAMTAMFNSGPGLNELGPVGNFSAVPDAGKLMLAFLMVLGRLEFYTVLALLLPSFWRR